MNNEEKILSMLENLTTELKDFKQETNQRFGKLEQGQAKLQKDVSYLTEDVTIVRQIATKNEHELHQLGIVLREGFYDNEKLAENYEPRIVKLEDITEDLAIDVSALKSKIS